jgi:hypothetical protein
MMKTFSNVTPGIFDRWISVDIWKLTEAEPKTIKRWANRIRNINS